METTPFKWIATDDSRSESETLEQTANEQKFFSPTRDKLGWLKKIWPALALFAVLFVLHATRGQTFTTAKPASGEIIEVVMPLMPILKGQQIDFSVFEKVPLRGPSLTPSQKLRVVRGDHIENLHHPLRAKKTLAPHQIVLWSDLEAMPVAAIRQAPQIHFAN